MYVAGNKLLCATHSLKFISEVTLFTKFATLSYMFIKLSFSFQTNKISSQVKITYLTIPDNISQLRKEKQKKNIIIRKKGSHSVSQQQSACSLNLRVLAVPKPPGWGGGVEKEEGEEGGVGGWEKCQLTHDLPLLRRTWNATECERNGMLFGGVGSALGNLVGKTDRREKTWMKGRKRKQKHKKTDAKMAWIESRKQIRELCKITPTFWN